MVALLSLEAVLCLECLKKLLLKIAGIIQGSLVNLVSM